MADLQVPEVKAEQARRAIVTCMDRGEDVLLLPFQDMQTAIFRAAGPTLQEWMVSALRSGAYQEVMFWSHGDCGADKTAWAYYKKGDVISDQVTRWIKGAYDPLHIASMSDLHELELAKLPYQKRELEGLLKRSISERFVEKSELKRGENEHHVLVVSPPLVGVTYTDLINRLNKGRFGPERIEMRDVYFVHASNLGQVMPDIEIASRRLAEEVFVMSLKPNQNGAMAVWVNAIRDQAFMRDMEREPTLLPASVRRLRA